MSTWAQPGRPVPPAPLRTSDHLVTIGAGFKHILDLQWELGKAEGRQFVRSVAVAAALALIGVILALASLVVLAAGLVALAVGVRWEHLVWPAVVGVVLGVASGSWAAYRFKNLPWPTETHRSVEETLSWLGAQLRYRLRFG
jgi:Putative Actinobacterial Holin-X, holin superfamily III